MSNIKWSYMDHWLAPSSRGLRSPYSSVQAMDVFARQIAAVGITGFETFGHKLAIAARMFGSNEKFERFLQERGIEKIVSVFWAQPNATPKFTVHDTACHDAIFEHCQNLMRSCEGLSIEKFVIMPTNAYFDVAPVTDEKLRAVSELWNRVGYMSRQYGVQLACHHEFWSGVRTEEQIRKFYEWTDPEAVSMCIDTAQHVIAGVDPIALYAEYEDRVSCFHFKDTHDIDLTDDYSKRPDPELAAATTGRWFHEMGTAEGKVDFEGLMHALKDRNYSGWICVEHDKANVDGGDYAESTAVAMWYAKNVLSKIYS